MPEIILSACRYHQKIGGAVVFADKDSTTMKISSGGTAALAFHECRFRRGSIIHPFVVEKAVVVQKVTASAATLNPAKINTSPSLDTSLSRYGATLPAQ